MRPHLSVQAVVVCTQRPLATTVATVTDTSVQRVRRAVLTLVALDDVTDVPLRLSLIKPERLDPAVQQQLVEKTLRKRRAKEEMTESYYFM